ncbi:MAG TPA: hypothetical protein VE046_08900 [Steroidobacteraceae bacterium]|nr:hypothetical protein [Steroidobacteraceae bacterium]
MKSAAAGALAAATPGLDSTNPGSQPWVTTEVPVRGIDDELTMGAVITSGTATAVPGKRGQIYFSAFVARTPKYREK